jgi:Cys-tRNA(Pro)/Cys-tRNA(Cys) deacylase
MEKTNSMRLLDQRGVDYEVFTFSPDTHSAMGVAEVTGFQPQEVFKTLVVMRPNGKAFLVIAPGDGELNLKKVAAAVGEKKVAMASQRDAESITGLQVGGISALALLQKGLPVYIDRSATEHERILVSAGKRGVNLRLKSDDLIRIVKAKVIDAAD